MSTDNQYCNIGGLAVMDMNDEAGMASIIKKKYILLLDRCHGLQRENALMLLRLFHLKKNYRRQEKIRLFLKQRLANFSEDFDPEALRLTERQKALSQLPSTSEPTPVKRSSPTKRSRSEKDRGRSEEAVAPRKPVNAFFMYCQQERSSLLKENPWLSHHDLMRHMAKTWADLPHTDKKVFYGMYEQDKRRYHRELRSFGPVKKKVKKMATLAGSYKKKYSKKMMVELSDSTHTPMLAAAMPGVEPVDSDHESALVLHEESSTGVMHTLSPDFCTDDPLVAAFDPSMLNMRDEDLFDYEP